MISARFAPNETKEDALASYRLLSQQDKWFKGIEQKNVTEWIANEANVSPDQITLALTGRSLFAAVVTACGWEAGSEVIVPAFTCEAVVVPMKAKGMVIRYADITDLDYSSNPQSVKALISNKTRCLLIQHTFGITPNRKELLALAAQNNLWVIEDVAHGWEPLTFNDAVTIEPSLQGKVITILSFGRSKMVSSVFGGAVITPDNTITQAMKAIVATYPELPKQKLVKLLNYKPITYMIRQTYGLSILGRLLHTIALKLDLLTPEISAKEKQGIYDADFACQYPNALASLLVLQLNRLPETRKNRIKNVTLFAQGFQLPHLAGLSLSRFPVLVTNRQEVMKKAKNMGYQFGSWYTQPIAPEGLDLAAVDYTLGMCPVAETICAKIINLPTNGSDSQTNEMIDLVGQYR